jgi:hypothetical protein
MSDITNTEHNLNLKNFIRPSKIMLKATIFLTVDVKVKLKVTLEQVTEVYRGSRGIVLLFL